MTAELRLLIITAISISFLHTLCGPDHYLPFITLSKTKKWSLAKTLGWTIVCGCGHVWSSVVLGLIMVTLGWSLASIKGLEAVRGGAAGWLLLVFGLGYTLWACIRLKSMASHQHFDVSDDGALFVYNHKHGSSNAFQRKYKVTPWILFVIFVLGPSEPMIPLLYLPAAKASWGSMVILIISYTLFTLLAMVIMVLAGYYGLFYLKTAKIERYMHVLGGASLLICGAGIVFLNW